MSGPAFTAWEPGVSPLSAYAAAKQLPEEHLRELGLRDDAWHGKPALAVPYHDEDGEEFAVRYRVTLNGKRPMRSPTGAHAKGLVYGLERRKHAVAAGYALVVEGESDRQTAALHGVPAFGIPGAGMYDDERAGPCFDGIETLYVVREPGPAGEAFVRAFAGSRHAERVRVLELGEHEDVSALHLAVGGDRDKFLAALEEARRQARPLEREAGEEAEQSATPYPTLDLAAFLAQPPAEPPWDWHGWYARGDTVLVAGDPGVGKSLVALALVVTAARGGGELFGEAVAARRTLYIDLESPEDVVFDRLRGLGVHEAKQPPAYVHRPPAFNLLDREGLARLGATVRATGAELVVIDSLRRAAPGLDENDSREVSILFSALRDLAAALGCTIIVIHHPRKPVGDAKVEALYAARGSGDLTGSVDSYLFFRKLAGGLCRIEHGKARRGREHEPVTYRIVEGEAGEPVLENVEAAPAATLEEVRERVLSWLVANPDEHAKSKVRKSVTGRDGLIDEALRELYEEGLVGLRVGPAKNRPLTVGPEEWADWADRRVATYWEACSHAASEVGPASGPTGADSEPRTSVGGGSRPSRPVPEGAAAGGPTTAEVADPGPEPHLEREEDANGDIPW